MTDHPILKPGDRFEMTVRGVVAEVNNGFVYAILDGGELTTDFAPAELAAAKITVLEPELRVGRAMTSGGTTGRVLALHGKLAWFARDNAHDEPWTYVASDLRNIPEDQ